MCLEAEGWGDSVFLSVNLDAWVLGQAGSAMWFWASHFLSQGSVLTLM